MKALCKFLNYLACLCLFDVDRPRKKRFKHRKELGIAELKAQYFPYLTDDNGDFEEIWTGLGRSVGVHPGKLRPDDRFDGILRPPEGFEAGDDDLGEFLDYHLKKKQKTAQVCKFSTIRDAINALLIQ